MPHIQVAGFIENATVVRKNPEELVDLGRVFDLYISALTQRCLHQGPHKVDFALFEGFQSQADIVCDDFSVAPLSPAATLAAGVICHAIYRYI